MKVRKRFYKNRNQMFFGTAEGKNLDRLAYQYGYSRLRGEGDDSFRERLKTIIKN